MAEISSMLGQSSKNCEGDDEPALHTPSGPLKAHSPAQVT